MGFLCEYSRQNSNDCPAQKATICCRVATIKETVFLFWMTVNITVDPYVSFFVCELLEKISNVVNLWMEFLVRGNPLSIQVDTCYWISVITADHSIRIKHRYQNECIELAQKFSFLSIWTQEIKDSFKHSTGWCLSWVDSARDNDLRFFLQILRVTWYCYLPQGKSTNWPTHLLPSVVQKQVLIFKRNSFCGKRSIFNTILFCLCLFVFRWIICAWQVFFSGVFVNVFRL